jgi:parvulin-like peptidyl-prolyl isomerase
MRELMWRILLPSLILTLLACGGGNVEPPDPAARTIVLVGDRQISKGAFEVYVIDALGGAEEASNVDSEVKSRLLDQFIDEELLVGAALDEGLSVTEEELDRFLPGTTGNQERVRRVLLQKKYKEQVILRNLSVSDQEVMDYFQRNQASFRRPARAVLRKVLLDSAHEAREVRADLVKNPRDFEGIAETRSLSPDGGRPQEYKEESLPESLREVVASLREGQLSPVVEDPMGFFILKLEERRPERVADLEEVRDQIELRLLQEKGEQRFRESLAALRRGARIEIRKGLLDFEYVSRDSS